MAKLKLSSEFAQAVRAVADEEGHLELDVTGSTVHSCIDEAARRVDERIGDFVLEHDAGRKWDLAGDVLVTLNGRDVRDLDGLGTPVQQEDVIEVAPMKGHALPFDN